jgi:hypothetical protein
VAQVVNGRFTARTDEPFVVFRIGMWLPLHKNPAAVERGVIPAGPIENYHNVPAV